MTTRVGKIARLPENIREDLNKRIVNGQLAPTLLPWLNGMPEVQAVLAEHFGGAQITPQNLSDWRLGGHKAWLQSRDRHFQRIEHTRELAKMSMELAQAGGGTLTDGAAAIMAGQILELFESMEEMGHAASSEEKSKLLERLSTTVARIRSGDIQRELVALKRAGLVQGAETIALAREKFQRDTCALFLRWAEDQRAREIASSGGDNADKIARLGQLMFGEDWVAEQNQQEQTEKTEKPPSVPSVSSC